jgi:hypothetical protein
LLCVNVKVLTGHETPRSGPGVLSLLVKSNEGAQVVSSGRDGKIICWDPVVGNAARVLKGHGVGSSITNGQVVCALSTTSEGELISGSWDTTAKAPLLLLLLLLRFLLLPAKTTTTIMYRRARFGQCPLVRVPHVSSTTSRRNPEHTLTSMLFSLVYAAPTSPPNMKFSGGPCCRSPGSAGAPFRPAPTTAE